MTDREKRNALKARLEKRRERATWTVTTWHENFSCGAPAHSLQYCDEIFDAAAIIRTLNVALDKLEMFKTYEMAIDYFRQAFMERALGPTKSTSESANMLERGCISAWAGVLDEVRYVE